MLIGGLQRLTLIDYPGKISCTVFLTGCNFYCPWCYSSELVLPGKIKKQPVISEKEFFYFLKKRKGLLEGVVICGGEPTLNKELPEFVKKIKKMGYLVKLDTNGSNPKMLGKLIKEKLVDYVAMDIKAPLGAKFEIRNSKSETLCQISKYEEEIERSIGILKKGKVDYEFRSTIVPGIHGKKAILEMAKMIKGAKRYYLQNFRPEKTIDSSFEKIKPYPKEFLKQIQKQISPYFKICQMR